MIDPTDDRSLEKLAQDVRDFFELFKAHATVLARRGAKVTLEEEGIAPEEGDEEVSINPSRSILRIEVKL